MNFIVKHTKTEKIYVANTFVIKIYIQNKTRHWDEGPMTLTGLYILLASPLSQSEEASSLNVFPLSFLYCYVIWLLTLNLKFALHVIKFLKKWPA